MNILLSGYITSESKIMIHRNIQDRVRTIAPFLQLDRDPYLAISDGRLFWIEDAYTSSDWFPFAKPEPGAGDINYIRNSVKIVIDAYNGTVAFYVADAADPIIATYPGSSPRCFGRSRPCRRTCDSTFATPRTFSPFRLSSTARSTWTCPRSSTIARTYGNFLASRPPPTRWMKAARRGCRPTT